MRIASVFLVATLRLVLLPTTARAQQEPAQSRDSSMFADLGLSADQRAKVAAIRQAVQQENAPLRAQMRQITGGKSFRDLNPAARDSLRPKLDPIRRQLMQNMRKGREQVMAILTPEQRRQFLEHARNRRGGRPAEQ